MSIWHPFTQHGIAGPAIEIERAQGAHLFTKDGRKIIDGISSWWVNTHGHCHPKIAAAVKHQADKLEQVIFAGFTHQPAETLAQKLLRLANGGSPPLTPPQAGGDFIKDAPRVRGNKGRNAPQQFTQIFFSDSGSTAVEVALKMAIGYWSHTGKPRRRIVTLESGYHGDTFGAMSAGAKSAFTKLYEPYLFEVTRLPLDNMTDAFEKILKDDGDNIAALLVEPLILGVGGMKIYPAENLKTLRALCDRHGILLIADEVMTGFGRTGTMFACEQANITPDILCLSKGLTGGFLPLGATLCCGKIYDAFYSRDRAKMFMHSSSFMGNALACAAANANLEIWETEPVLERIQSIAAAHKTAAARFQKRNDVANVRHIGAILAFDVKTDGQNAGYLSSLAPRLYDFFLSRDVLLRPLGETVYIMPPYCITPEDLAHVYNVTELALDSLRHDGKQRAA